MKPIRHSTGFAALGIAVAVHVGFGVGLFWQPESKGAAQPGVAGLQVGLLAAGAAPGTIANAANGIPDASMNAPAAAETVSPDQVPAVDQAAVVPQAQAVAQAQDTAPPDQAVLVQPVSPVSVAEPEPMPPVALAEPEPVKAEPVAVVETAAPVPSVDVKATETSSVPIKARPVGARVPPPPPTPTLSPDLRVAVTAVAATLPHVTADEPVALHAPPPLPPPAPRRNAVAVLTETEQVSPLSPSAVEPVQVTETASARDQGPATRTHGEVQADLVSAPGAGGTSGRNADDGRANDAGTRTGGGTPGQQADYLTLLQIWLEQHKEYPRRAQRRHQQGTAMLYFRMSRDGMVLDFRIEQSSGHTLLDREVAAMIKRAQPLPAMPDFMTQARLELVVPVVFAIR